MVFSASEPLGPSNEPESRMVGAPLSSETPIYGATCTYQGQSYGYGIVICMGGTQYACGNSGWHNLNTPCWTEEDIAFSCFARDAESVV